MSYLVDANIFISTYERDYPVAVFPRLWSHFTDLVVLGELVTLNRVADEVQRYEDESAAFFVRVMPDGSVHPAEQYLSEYAGVIAWSQTRADHFKQKALDDFAENAAADAWLVAAGLNTGFTVLTAETSEPSNTR